MLTQLANYQFDCEIYFSIKRPSKMTSLKDYKNH